MCQICMVLSGWFGHPNQDSATLDTFLVETVNPYIMGPQSANTMNG